MTMTKQPKLMSMLESIINVVAGFGNKVQAAIAAVTPQSALAEMHRKQAEPKT